MQQKFSLSLPLYDFPTTLVFVDDDEIFVDILCKRLRLELIKTSEAEGYFNFKIFYNAREALNFFKKVAMQEESFINLKRVESADGDAAVRMDFSELKNLIYDTHHYQFITTIVLDEYMPELSGAQLCAQIRGKSATDNLNLSCPVLILTGNADYEFGISTMMENGAEGFIHKGDTQQVQKLKEKILAFKKKIFLEHSQRVLENIIGATKGNSLLINPEFAEFFKKIRTDNKAVEYVVLDAYGSTFFQTLEGEKSILVIKHESQLEDLHSRLECYDCPEKISEIAQAICSRTKIPFFFSEEESNLPIEKWSSYLHTAKPFEGLPGYYYAYITDLSAYDLNVNKIPYFKQS